MARPSKIGLDYFPFEVDLFHDIKIRKLIRYQGGKAFTVYALLLCFIYKSGYYARWDTELPFIISEQTGFEEAYISEVIKSCLALGLLSKRMFDDGILTSKGIQERYEFICQQSKRKAKITEYSLINSEETDINSEETMINSELMPQRKEKKSKLKETSPKGESKKAADATFSPAHENQVEDFKTDTGSPPETQEEERKSCAKKKEEHDAELTERRRQKFYNSLVPYVQQYGKQMIREFYDYWSEQNKSRTKMRFEMERTWDTAKRLARWDMNNKDFKKRDYGCEKQKRFGNTAPDDFKGKGSTEL